MNKNISETESTKNTIQYFRQTPRFWRKQSFTHYIMLPLSWVFYLLVSIRRFFYEKKLFISYKAPVPVIIVGNLIVGGAGKTPLVIGLTEFLQEKEIIIGVVSRGYGRTIKSNQDVLEVSCNSNVNLVGDEPLLIKQTLKCPVFVGKHRANAVKALIEKNPEVNIVICDDGLQHYRLNRDIEIAVMTKHTKNQCLLPAGPYREPNSRLMTTDISVLRGDTKNGYTIKPKHWRNLGTGIIKSLHYFDKTEKNNLIAITGIAKPEHFVNLLAKLSLNVKIKTYPDHFDYTGDEINPTLITLTTTKDAIKLSSLGNFDNVWVLEIEVILSKNLKNKFIDRLNALPYNIKKIS